MVSHSIPFPFLSLCTILSPQRELQTYPISVPTLRRMWAAAGWAAGVGPPFSLRQRRAANGMRLRLFF